MKISYRNTKNVDIFSSLLMTKHAEIKILPPLYWIPSTVLMLSPHSTDVIPPHVLMLSPQCTEYPPQDWSYPPLYWCYPPTVLNNLHSTEAIPHMYCCYPPTVLKISLHSTEYPPQYWCYPPHVLMLSPTVLNNLHSTEATLHSTEAIPPLYWTTSTVLKLSPTLLNIFSHSTDVIPPMYWTTSNVLNNLHSTEPTLYGVIYLRLWKKSGNVIYNIHIFLKKNMMTLKCVNLIHKTVVLQMECFLNSNFWLKKFLHTFVHGSRDQIPKWGGGGGGAAFK